MCVVSLVGWFLALLPPLPNIKTITVAGTALVKAMLLNPRTSYHDLFANVMSSETLFAWLLLQQDFVSRILYGLNFPKFLFKLSLGNQSCSCLCCITAVFKNNS